MAGPAGNEPTGDPVRQSESPQRKRRPIQFPTTERHYLHATAL
ncbi:hypothetical protein BN191_380005 [Clostridioides difficile T61]|nr:hypothetical protein BN169_500037 [Clostridioides difficile E16]CCL94518.1 hypothetical protein BN191_380005 [Clostridioides difficile T61]